MAKVKYDPNNFDALGYLAQEQIKRRLLKKLYKQKEAQPIKSLADDTRIRYDEDGEGWREYGFYEDEPDLTDEELDKLIWDSLAIRYQYREYDCTGQPFTSWINWHRNPNGLISVINRVCLDV